MWNSSKLTIKKSKRSHWRSGVCIVNFKHILRLSSSVSVVNFEEVNAVNFTTETTGKKFVFKKLPKANLLNIVIWYVLWCRISGQIDNKKKESWQLAASSDQELNLK